MTHRDDIVFINAAFFNILFTILNLAGILHTKIKEKF